MWWREQYRRTAIETAPVRNVALLMETWMSRGSPGWPQASVPLELAVAEWWLVGQVARLPWWADWCVVVTGPCAARGQVAVGGRW